MVPNRLAVTVFYFEAIDNKLLFFVWYYHSAVKVQNVTQVSSDRASPERTETEVIASKTTSSVANLLINLVDKMKLIIK